VDLSPDELARRLGHTFSAPVLGVLRSGTGRSYRRLSFVGDSILDVLATMRVVGSDSWTDEDLANLAEARRRVAADPKIAKATATDDVSRLVGLQSAAHQVVDVVGAAVGAAYLEAGWGAATTLADTLVLRHFRRAKPTPDGSPPPGSPSPKGRPSVDVEGIQRAIGHTFTNPGLLVSALAGGVDTRRLAYLGGKVIDAATGQSLYQRHPEADTSALSAMRSQLTTSAAIAGHAMRFVGSLLPVTGRRREDTDYTARLVKAVIGAVALDAGPALAMGTARRLMQA